MNLLTKYGEVRSSDEDIPLFIANKNFVFSVNVTIDLIEFIFSLESSPNRAAKTSKFEKAVLPLIKSSIPCDTI
jgi:hypothetical protein